MILVSHILNNVAFTAVILTSRFLNYTIYLEVPQVRHFRKDKIMRILMVSLPFSGHVNPTLGMAKTLVERGHIVDFILSNQWKKQVENTGANFVPYDNFPANPTALDLRRLSFKAASDTTLRVGKNYECLIYEMLFFPGKSIADNLRIPAIRLFSTFALNDDVIKEIVSTGGPLIGLFNSKK